MTSTAYNTTVDVTLTSLTNIHLQQRTRFLRTYSPEFYLNGRTLSSEATTQTNTHTRTLAFSSSYAASAPIATSRSLHWLLCSAMPVHLCTAMATASTRCVPIIAASRHVLWLPAEW